MSYFSTDEKYMREVHAGAEPRASNPAPTPAATPRPSGYFRADETVGAGSGEAVRPWGLTLRETAEVGRVNLAWHKPYGMVQDYQVQGRSEGGEWWSLAECSAASTAVDLDPGVGSWRLRVAARINGQLIASAEEVDWQGRRAVAAPVAEAPPFVPPATPEPVDTRREPGCPMPGCGASLQLSASGTLRCGYCATEAVLREDGSAVAVGELLYGACSCCRPRRPLIRAGDELVCVAHPNGPRYPLPGHPGGRQPRPVPAMEPAAELEPSWEAIDRALRDNSAFLGTHGLFVRPR